MKKITVDEKTGRVRVQNLNTKPSRTQQQFKDQCDVNKLMARYKKAGYSLNRLPDPQKGVYADLTQIPDYVTSLNTIRKADSAFADLPAELRLRFSNDPQKLIEFLNEEKNYDEGVKLGLLKPRPVVEQPPENEQKKPKQKNEKVAPPTPHEE